MAYTKKTSITKRNIKRSLINLLENNKFDLITINQIIVEAEITRSTFYRYFEDKYDLLSDIEEEILEQIHKVRNHVDAEVSTEDMFDTQAFKQLFQSLDPYSESIQRLLSNHGDASFEMKLKNEIAKRFVHLKNIKNVSNVRVDLVKEYMYVILIKTLQYWSANKNDANIDEIASTVRDIQLKGLRKTIGL